MRNIPSAELYRSYRQIVTVVACNYGFSQSQVRQGTFVYDSRMVEGDSFQVGTAVADEIQVELDNTTGVYGKNAIGEEFEIYLSATDGTNETDRYLLGTFICVGAEETSSNISTLTMQDKMILFDKVIGGFSLDTLYANLNAFCDMVKVPLKVTEEEKDLLSSFDITSATNEQGATGRDLVRACGLLMCENAYITDTGYLSFKSVHDYGEAFTPSERFSSEVGEKAKIGGLVVADDEGTILYNGGISGASNILIDPSSSIILDFIGGVSAVAEVYETALIPGRAIFGREYYPLGMATLSWWEIETGDIIRYVTKGGEVYPSIVTSCASVLNGKTSITSTADEELRDIPTQTDAIRTTNNTLKQATQEAMSTALTALPKYCSCSTASGTADKVTTVVNGLVLESGTRVTVLFANGNTAYKVGDTEVTLSIPGQLPKPIRTSDNQQITSANYDEVSWPDNSLVTFVYDGSVFRIDDQAALTKIDHILTQNIVGDNGWINLKGGEFVFTDADTGDSIGFNDGYLTVTGTIDGSVIEGEKLNIEGHGQMEGQLTSQPDYHYRIRTKDSTYPTDSGNYLYRSVELASWLTRGSLAETIGETRITMDPANGIKVEGFVPDYDGDFLSVESSYNVRMGSDGDTVNGNYLLVGNVDAFLSNNNYNSIANRLGLTPISYIPSVGFNTGSVFDVLNAIVDAMFFKAGDTFVLDAITNVGGTTLAGLVTSTAHQARFGVPVGKSLKNVTSVTVTECKGGMRVPTGGYVNGLGDSTDWLAQSGITVDAHIVGEHMVLLRFVSTSAFTNVSNNMPVSMAANHLTLEFS